MLINKPTFSLLAAFFTLLTVDNWAVADWDIAQTGQPYTDVSFTLTEGTWISVDVSPNGKTIVFDLLGDIYQISARGGDATVLHSGPAMQRMPRYNADGSQIMYLSDASGSDNIWLSDADGNNSKQLTQMKTDVLNSPSWGPNGEYAVATQHRASNDKLRTSEIRLFHLGGGSGRLLVDKPQSGENVGEAVVSKDGRYLYYTEKVLGPERSYVYVDANHTNYVVRRKDLKTGTSETLVKGFGSATTAQISVDGKQLAFIRRVKNKTVLFIYDLHSGQQRPVFDQLDRDAHGEFIIQGTYYPAFSWFPDNRHIAVWGKGKIVKVDTKKSSAKEIPFRVTSQHRITETARFSYELAPPKIAVKAIDQLAVSVEKKRVVFNALGRLWQQNLPTGTAQRVTKNTGFEADAVFSSDGKRMAYIEWQDEKGSVLTIVNTRNNKISRPVSTSAVIRHPSFSTNGKRLVYIVQPADKCMGGYGTKPGIYWLDEKGNTQRVAKAGRSPQFSPDGQRIIFSVTDYVDGNVVTRIESVDLKGLDRRRHAIATGADTLELKLSPDMRWLTFRAYQQYYLLPYRETGSPVLVSKDTATLPVTQLTALGGYGLHWSTDSSTVYWALGQALFRATLTTDGNFAAEPLTTINLTVPTDTPKGTIAFTNGRIITMKGDKVIEQGTVVIEGNKIVAVAASNKVTLPKGAKIIDIKGKTLMPGLVNMHGHLEDCYYTSTGLLPQKQASHYASLAFGITTNFDPYSTEIPSYSSAEINKVGISVGPRLISVGNVIYGREGKSDSVYNPINNYADAETVMRRKRALGGTVIKSYRQPMRRQRQQLIKAGRENGVMVDVEGESHFYNNITMILDGHMCLEHNLPIANYYDDVVQLMAHSRVANTPTLVVTFAELSGENYYYQNTRDWDDPRIKSFVQETTSSYNAVKSPHSAPPHVRGMTSLYAVDERWDIGFRSVAKSLKKLDDAGVLINAGSHGQIQGLAMHWEMGLLSQGGISNHRVLRTATINGAKTLGLDKQIGSIEVGKLADLIVLDNNPLDDIKHTNSVRYTLINGRLYDAMTMNEIGNSPRTRGKFYWEDKNYNGIDWNESWSEL